jgi:hypothetical protein
MTAGMTKMPRGYTFKTHQTILSSTPPRFESFTRLSASGAVEKWLAGKGGEIVFTSDRGEPCRRDVRQGGIVLSERKGGLWVLQVPGAGGWTKPYSANGREKSIDSQSDAMLARDLARSASAYSEARV